jgi:hypothetical protein
MVSDAWRNMGPEEREVYDDLAREDKARYEKEKANYQGPLGGAGSKKVKDPNAPKRPMSAFLAFANSRRGEVKGRNSECSNGEISKLLSVMWKEADEDIKKKYRENEAALWAAYKVSIAEYRKKNDGRKKAKAVEDFDDDEDSPAPAKKRKKRKVKQSKHDEEDIPPVSGEEFDDHHLSGGGFDTLGNPNQDEMMAASALRGVRGGPNSYSFGGSSGNDLQKQLQQQQDQLDRLQQQQQQQLEQAQMNSSGYSSLFGMSGMNPYAALSGGGGNGNNGLSGSLPSGLGVGALSGGLGGSGMPGGLGGNGMSGSLGGGGLSGGLGVGGLSGGLGGSGLPGGLGGSGLPGGLGVGSLPGGLGGSGLGGSGLGGSGLGGGLGGSGLPSGLGGGGLSQDNSRALLEMGIPYGLQNYGGLGGNGLGGGGLGGGGLGGGGLGGGGLGGSGLGGLGGGGLSGGGLGGGGLGVGGLGGGGLGGSLGDSQAMLMAQALHGNPNPYNNHLLGLGGGTSANLDYSCKPNISVTSFKGLGSQYFYFIFSFRPTAIIIAIGFPCWTTRRWRWVPRLSRNGRRRYGELA